MLNCVNSLACMAYIQIKYDKTKDHRQNFLENSLIQRVFFVYVGVNEFYYIGSAVINIYQAYEYAIMINLIAYQKGKKVSDIMYQMSNKETRDAFRRRESIIGIIFHLMIIPVIFIKVL